ncbi:MAG: nucleotide exchange factor GrpE [Chthoniobacterales bacterium]|nr:nucleotide exchange factor GrpE [Chthoniobacterales bacterium]
MPAPTEIKLEAEFASTMQQLVAEAQKTTPSPAIGHAGMDRAAPDRLAKEVANLGERIAGFETAMSQGLKNLTNALPKDDQDFAGKLQRVDDHLLALRDAESLNQRLFNSLHQELKSYRDNFLRESLQKPFIRDLVVLFDDLSSVAAQMESASAGMEQSKVSQWSSNLQNSIHSLMEILHRMEVTEIESKEVVDRAFHKVVSYEPANFAEDDGRIVLRIKRGFIWRDQVLRPEEVVAKRFS